MMSTALSTRKKLGIAVAIMATWIVSGCSDSGVGVAGNSSPPSGESGSQPSTSLTFSNRADVEGELRTEPGDGVLISTLASSDSEPLSFEELQVLVFGPMCAGCHVGGGISQPSVFDFTNADATYESLVNQPSTLDPAMTLVVPGNANESQLVRTLLGTQTLGSRMPLRAEPVSDDLMSAIQVWIDSGAAR